MKRLMPILCVVVVLLVIACAPPSTPPPPAVAESPTVAPAPTATPSPTATPTPEPPAVKVYEPLFEPAPCPFVLAPDEIEGETIQCGFVAVPEVRSDPNSSMIRLAVAVLKATGPETSMPDPVILLSGGPGEKTVANTAGAATILAPFRAQRDLIVFDQRGVGLSEPALECPEWDKAYLDSLDEADIGARLRTLYDATLVCRDRLVAEGINLPAYNTMENAADVNDIRRALGYGQVNLYGGSYGTLLAQTVLRNHPEGVRSAIMGAVLPAEKSFFVHVPITTINAVLRLLDNCAADQACSAAYPNLQQVLLDTVQRLDEEPVPITLTSPLDGKSYDALLTGDDVVNNLTVFLYLTDIIPVLPKAVNDVANGDYELMTRLSSLHLALMPVNTRGMTFSVLCAEDLIGMTPADYMEVRAQVPPALLGKSDPEDEIEYGFFGICDAWPVPEADPSIKQPVSSDVPVLLLEGELDPVTPPAYAEEVASYLSNSYLYTFPGVGHNVLVASPCAQAIARDFVDDPTQAPDASCLAEMTGVAFDLPTAEDGEITLVPFEQAGFSGVTPEGWQDRGGAAFVRGQDALDPTGLIYDRLEMDKPDVLQLLQAQLSLPELPEPVDQRAANFDWTLYSVQVQGIFVDFAVAEREDGTSLLVVLQSQPDERDALIETVFLPALDALQEAEAAAEPPEEETVVNLVPYTSATFGIQGVAPEGWAEIAPGVLNRGQSSSDLARLIQQAAPAMTVDALSAQLLPQLGLDALPESSGALETAAFDWTLYTVEIDVPGIGPVLVDLALAETGDGAYIVLLQAPAEEYDNLHETVFLPAVQALARL